MPAPHSLRMAAVHALGAAVALLLVPAAMAGAAAWLPYDFLPGGLPSILLGASCSAVGLLFIFWSLRELIVKGRGGAAAFGRLELTPKTSFLVTSGPYAVCRNPMHLGLTFFYLGVACALNSLVCLAIPALTLAAAWALAVFVDEPRLRRDFADDYERWAARVPRFWPRKPQS